MTNAVLWVEVVVFAFFMGLRLYTRKFILNAIGVDDFLVVAAFVSCNSPCLRIDVAYAKAS